MSKRYRMFFVIAMLMFVVTGCGEKENQTGKQKYSIYYLDREETKIDAFDYYSATDDTLLLAGELIETMSRIPENVNYHEPVHNFSIIGYQIVENQIVLSVNEDYYDLTATTEVLTRAALVRTLTQISGIEYVSMKIRNEDLVDNMGNVVGVMSASQFVDNAGNEINSYEKVKLTLYFASDTGDYLIKANRTVVYNSNISLEKLVVEQLINGPTNEDLYATINPNTKIVNVTVKDGICYVNLDEGFLNQISNVSAKVALYSLVNSLDELQNVNKVQISINGNTDIVFRELYDLSNVYERNLDILEKKEE